MPYHRGKKDKDKKKKSKSSGRKKSGMRYGRKR